MFRKVLILCCLFPSILWGADEKIIASIRPLQSIIANIVGESKEVDLIVDKNESIHHYQLKPNKIFSIVNSDIIVVIDKNFETFLSKVIDTYSKDKIIIEVAKLPKMHLLKNTEDEHEEESDEAHEHHHHFTEYDYHLWLDPDNIKIVAQALTEVFSKKYPDSAELYQQNLTIFIKKLNELNSRIRAKLLLSRNKNFIVTHNAYDYFITKYDLSKPQAISINHDRNIGARDLLALQQSIAEKKVVCIFEEPQFRSNIIEKLQKTTKINVGTLDAEWGSDDLPIKEVYFNLMDTLADNFNKCLR